MELIETAGLILGLSPCGLVAIDFLQKSGKGFVFSPSPLNFSLFPPLAKTTFARGLMIMARQINKKWRLNRQGWEEQDNDHHSIHDIVEIPQIPDNIYPPQLSQNIYYYINNEVDCETPHHLDVGEQYNHSLPQ